ncbi:MAG: ADP-ribosylglycohydrolase family protein [Cyanobacteria bacterium P01_G01_bin.39]
MKHQIFEQFQGMWFGGIVGQALANRKHDRKLNNIIKFPSQHWVWKRQQIAKILLSNTEVELDYIEQQLDKVRDLKCSLVNNDNLTLADADHQTNQLNLLINSNHPLLLTSCIFLPQQQNLLLKDGRIDQALVAWHNLLRLVMSSERQLDFALVVEQVRQKLERKEDLLMDKLQQIVVDVQESLSLCQLYEELQPFHNALQMAIALSWFCFISTPQDYKLSVLRAASLDSTLASVITALTGTLSGAYNGITAIPGNWQRKIRLDSNYDSENQVLLELYKTWLGIYSINRNQELYNYQIDAVAICQMIQPRKTLQIISQEALEI